MEFWTLTIFFDRKFVKISNKTLTLVSIRMNISLRKWWMEAGIYVTEYGKDNSLKLPYTSSGDFFHLKSSQIAIIYSI